MLASASMPPRFLSFSVPAKTKFKPNKLHIVYILDNNHISLIIQDYSMRNPNILRGLSTLAIIAGITTGCATRTGQSPGFDTPAATATTSPLNPAEIPQLKLVSPANPTEIPIPRSLQPLVDMGFNQEDIQFFTVIGATLSHPGDKPVKTELFQYRGSGVLWTAEDSFRLPEDKMVCVFGPGQGSTAEGKQYLSKLTGKATIATKNGVPQQKEYQCYQNDISKLPPKQLTNFNIDSGAQLFIVDTATNNPLNNFINTTSYPSFDPDNPQT